MHIFAAISRIKVKQLLSSYYFHSIRLIKKQTSLVFSWLWEFEATELWSGQSPRGKELWIFCLKRRVFQDFRLVFYRREAALPVETRELQSLFDINLRST